MLNNNFSSYEKKIYNSYDFKYSAGFIVKHEDLYDIDIYLYKDGVFTICNFYDRCNTDYFKKIKFYTVEDSIVESIYNQVTRIYDVVIDRYKLKNNIY